MIARRKEARSRPAESEPAEYYGVTQASGLGQLRTFPLEQMSHAHDPDQTTEVFYTAIAQVNLTIDVRKHGIDRAIIGVRYFGKNIPVNIFQPQTGRQTIEANRPGVRLRQVHIEILDKRIVAYFSVTD